MSWCIDRNDDYCFVWQMNIIDWLSRDYNLMTLTVRIATIGASLALIGTLLDIVNGL